MSLSENPPVSLSASSLPADLHKALLIVACVLILGAIFRSFGIGQWDYESFLYLLAAAAVIMLPYAKKWKFGKNGFVFEGLKLEMDESIRQYGTGGKWTTPEKKTDNFNQKFVTLRSDEEGHAEVIDPADPQKGRWGSQSERNERRLSAEVSPLTDAAWFAVFLYVSSTDLKKPLTGNVIFHLHPTFKNVTPEIPVENGVAKLNLTAWGAFTVGVECDEGKTRLELDLMTLANAPKLFRER